MWNEDDIIKRCLQNERRAQHLLYEKFAPWLLGISIRFAGNRQEGEDILQEAFMRIFTNLSNYSGKGSLAAWMRKIVVNTAITWYHRNKKESGHYDLEFAGEKYISDKGPVEAEFTKEEMLKIIISLPRGYRMVFNLYAVDGYKHKEIARKLGIDVNTSKSQYSRAKKILREKLNQLKEQKM